MNGKKATKSGNILHSEMAASEISYVIAALRSCQQIFSAESNSCIVAPAVIGSHIDNFYINVNTRGLKTQNDLSVIYILKSDRLLSSDERYHKNDNNNEELKLETEHLLIEESQRSLKSSLKRNYNYLREGAINVSRVSLNSIYTELYITEGGSGTINQEHEVRQIEATAKSTTTDEKAILCNNLFKPQSGREDSVRTVLTRGVAGIGKTVATKKFTLDWAEDRDNTDFDFVFPLCFREINLIKSQKLNLDGLISVFFPEMKDLRILGNRKWKTLIILDGLDESRINLDFHNCEIISNASEANFIGVLLVNLIRGRLLPTCRIWITSRPAASSKIPGECVDLLTEVRGFNNPQKEEYFRRKIPNEYIANKIISHIKSCRSLYIMCHIPIFCWMSAKVLEKNDSKDLPKTLTQMYVHFLALFIHNMKQRLQNCTADIDDNLRGNLIALGKLAFKGLEKRNLVFYENDLRINGISAEQESIFSGIYTEIFHKDTAIYDAKMFSFVHLSVQEFFAALYVFLKFHNENDNVLIKKSSITRRFLFRESSELILYKEAIERALRCPDGHYDMFLRFLLGLSQELDQPLMRRMLTKNSAHTKSKEIIRYIKDKIHMGPPPNRCLNLFHCLNELNDRSLVEEIQSYIKAGRVNQTELSPAQWSSLVFVLLTSDEDLKTFELGNYARSPEGLLRMLPVVKAAQIVDLSGCGLSLSSCDLLSSALSSSLIQELDLSLNPITDAGLQSVCKGLALSRVHTLRLRSCGLAEAGAQSLCFLLSSSQCELKSLDLSDNDCGDRGVQILSQGLSTERCPLQVLNLSLCRVSERGCLFLASALNCSGLRELDLSFNHPGETGLQLMTALKDDPLCSLHQLSVEECGAHRIQPGPVKYVVGLHLDPDTAHKDLSLSNQNLSAVRELNPPTPGSSDQFRFWTQVLCTRAFTGRCYFEVQFCGRVCVGVASKHMDRRGEGPESRLGQNHQSWGLNCNKDGYKAVHKSQVTSVPGPLHSDRLGVFLDFHEGKLSFFGVHKGALRHIFTFHKANFTEPLYPAFHLAWIGARIQLR